MDDGKFAAVLPIIVGGLINKIVEKTHAAEEDAFVSLYNSELYSLLEVEETKLWTYSVPKLLDLYLTEVDTGKLELPEY